jgi:hypothetical protein
MAENAKKRDLFVVESQPPVFHEEPASKIGVSNPWPITPNLALVLPPEGATGWTDDVNGNFIAIDTVAGTIPIALEYVACAGAIPGSVFTSLRPPVAVAYNGILLREGQPAPFLSWTASGTTITLNFTAESGDIIDAFC